jgi:hypothetical protein
MLQLSYKVDSNSAKDWQVIQMVWQTDKCFQHLKTVTFKCISYQQYDYWAYLSQYMEDASVESTYTSLPLEE